MDIITCKSSNEVNLKSYHWLKEKVESFSATSLFLPAGNTPIDFYNYLEKLSNSEKSEESDEIEFFKHLNLYQIDEVLNDKEIFKNFFLKYLESFKKQFQWITGHSFFQADLAILGLGLNGHVGFHEPHLNSDFTFGEVDLSDKTIKSLELKKGTKGFSYGVGAFLNCHANLMIVLGESKREILTKILKDNFDCPASHLLKNSNSTLITDLEF